MIYDYGSDRENDGSFDVKKFYSEILALYPDSDSKCMEPSARFEDLLSRCSQSFGYIEYIKSIVLLARAKALVSYYGCPSCLVLHALFYIFSIIMHIQHCFI